MNLEAKILDVAPPREDWIRFRYCRSVLGKEEDFSVLDHSMTNAYKTLLLNSTSKVTQLSQPILEEILREEATKLSHQFPNSKLLFNHRLLDLNFNQKKVKILNESSKQLVDVETDLVIGADGAKSFVRDLSKLQISGKTFIESFASVHFTSPEISRKLKQGRKSAMLTFVFNPEVIAGVFVVHDVRENGNYIAHLPFFPPTETYQEFERKENLVALLRSLLGDEKVSFEIKSVRSWGMHATISDRFCDSSGWVALVGDACHQFPPAGGFGVNVGIAEVENLACKIALGLNNETAFLYENERKPIAQETLNVSLDNYLRGLKPAQALGLDKSMMNVFSYGLQTFGHVFGAKLLRSTSKFPVEVVTRSSPKIKAVNDIVQTQQSLPMFFPNVDLGADYSALKLSNEFQVHKVGRLVKHYWFWSFQQQRNISSLDLCNPFLLSLDENKVIKSTIFTTLLSYKKFAALTESRLVIVLPDEKDLIEPITSAILVVDRLKNKFFGEDDNISSIHVRNDGYVLKITH